MLLRTESANSSVTFGLPDVRADLDQLFAAGASPSWEQQLQAVRRIAQPVSLTALIQSILTNPSRLHEIAARSYVHENKFDKIVISSSSNPDYKLRLHIWWPCSEAPHAESIHNHQWTLSSVILVGTLRSQEFLLADSGQELLHYTYNSRPGLRNLPQRAANTALRCVSDAVLASGSFYVLSPDVLHRVISDPQSMTATLMLQGPADPQTVVHIFTAEAIDDSGAQTSETFADDVLAEKLRTLLQRLPRSLSTPHTDPR